MAIVGIDETEIPELRPLVKIGRAGRRRFEDDLRKTVEKTVERDALLNADEVFAERGVAEDRVCEAEERFFVRGIRHDPARVRLRFARRFFEVLLQAIAHRGEIFRSEEHTSE